MAVTYDAIDMYATTDTHKTHGGMFPANNPERTGVFVITNEAAGTADATVSFNGGTGSSRGAEWDYNTIHGTISTPMKRLSWTSP